MSRSAFPLCIIALVSAAWITLACGGGPRQGDSRTLLSITLSPATADAQDYPNGQVQFMATGYYNDAPYTVAPLSAGWGTCYQQGPTSAISVSRTGVAQCASGAVGTYTVWANDAPFPQGANCLAMTACGGGCFVAGTAQLTCP